MKVEPHFSAIEESELAELSPEQRYSEELIGAVDDWLLGNDYRGLDGDWREALRWVIERDGLPA